MAGHTGDVETARGFLADPAPAVRSTALTALARSGALTPDDAVTALADADPGVRRRAAEVVAAAGTEFDAVPLAPVLHDDEPTVVEVAAWAVGERLGRAAEEDRPLPQPELIAALMTIAGDHDDALCREAAVASLGAIGDDAALPTILAALDDKATVRRRAVIALAPFDGPEVDAALQRATEDRDWQVRQAAEDLLADD